MQILYAGVKRGLSIQEELKYRQECAAIIQEFGRLETINQVVVNAALTFMHHFYVMYSPTIFKTCLVGITAFYLACKSEDTPRKAEQLVKKLFKYILMMPTPSEDEIIKLIQCVFRLESAMLIVVKCKCLNTDHPHGYLKYFSTDLDLPKPLLHCSYFLCTNLLHLTTLVVHYKGAQIAAACVQMAAQWNSLSLPDLTAKEDKPWVKKFSKYIRDEKVIADITGEFLAVYERSPVKLLGMLRQVRQTRDGGNVDSIAATDTPRTMVTASPFPTVPAPELEEGEISTDPSTPQTNVKPRLSLADYRKKQSALAAKAKESTPKVEPDSIKEEEPRRRKSSSSSRRRRSSQGSSQGHHHHTSHHHDDKAVNPSVVKEGRGPSESHHRKHSESPQKRHHHHHHHHHHHRQTNHTNGGPLKSSTSGEQPSRKRSREASQSGPAPKVQNTGAVAAPANTNNIGNAFTGFQSIFDQIKENAQRELSALKDRQNRQNNPAAVTNQAPSAPAPPVQATVATAQPIKSSRPSDEEIDEELNRLF